jgi:hypothetical protein
MSTFDRIDPNHPLTEAARYVNAYADEQGLEATVNWLGMETSLSEVSYLAEQRALRAIYARRGINLNLPEMTNVMLTADERAMLPVLAAAYLDGFAIGWKARELKEAKV